MIPVQENLRVSVDQPLENQLPIHLKALIVAVSAIAAAVFGFWLAGLAGLALGALAGTGLGATALHLISWLRPSIAEQFPAATEIEFGPGPEIDPSLRWLTGTNSSTLGMMLALHRQGKIRDLSNVPALIPANKLLERGIAPLTGERGTCDYLAGVKEYPEIAVGYALGRAVPFDLQKAIQKAHVLPGDNVGEAEANIGSYLETLELIITRVLQMGMAPAELGELKEHLQKNVLPIFASGEAFRAHLYPRFGRYYQPADFNGRYSDVHCAELRLKAQAILTLFDRIEPLPLNPDERDLIEHSCPLVFASNSLDAKPLDPNGWFGQPGELVVEQPALLGQDLQYVYTTAADIDRIARSVAPFNVQVRDIATLVKQGQEDFN